MIFIAGNHPSETLMTTVTFVCQYCGNAVPQRVIQSANKVTVFFIPLFTLSTHYFVECSNCGGATELSREQAERSVAFAANAGGASGGAPIDYRPM